MKIIETKKSLISSLLFLLFGALLFAYPNKVVQIASMGIGAILVLYGIFMLIKNYYETKHDSNTSSTALVFGIVAIIVGILFIVLAEQVSQIIQYFIGIWIIFTGIERLIIALSLGKDTNSFITQLVLAILILAAGIYTIFRGHLEIQIIGLIMMIYAILEIVGYITNKKDDIIEKTNVQKEEVLTKITTKENDDDEIQEAKIIEEKPKKKKVTKKTTKKK